MQVHKIEIMVIDFDKIGVEGIKEVLENTKYPNRCINPEVISIQTRDIGEWDDDNPLNNVKSADAEYGRLFDKVTGA